MLILFIISVIVLFVATGRLFKDFKEDPILTSIVFLIVGGLFYVYT
jgi:hypothetical protein